MTTNVQNFNEVMNDNMNEIENDQGDNENRNCEIVNNEKIDDA